MDKESNVPQDPFLGLLLILFIGLKLTGHIDWAWHWVLAPLWLPLAIAGVLILLGLGIMAIAYFITLLKNR